MEPSKADEAPKVTPKIRKKKLRVVRKIIEIKDEVWCQCVKWATTRPNRKLVKTETQTVGKQRQEKEAEEKAWGNKMIGQEGNGNWTTKLGEGLTFHLLELLGKNPRKPNQEICKSSGLHPDWETDDAIYEVKTSNWWVGGTAGEKVLGTAIKYRHVPKLFGKPLYIVCLANQEDELRYGKTRFFGDEVDQEVKDYLALIKKWNIEYIALSDMLKDFSCK